jgi:hypothetical protein
MGETHQNRFLQLTTSANNYLSSTIDHRRFPWQTNAEFSNRKSAVHIVFTWSTFRQDGVVESITMNRISQLESERHEVWKNESIGKTFSSLAQKFNLTGPLNEENHKKLEKELSKDWRESNKQPNEQPGHTSSSEYSEKAMQALSAMFHGTLWLGKTIGHGAVAGAHFASDHYHFAWQSHHDFLARKSKVQITFGWNAFHGIYVYSAEIKDDQGELTDKSKAQLKTWYPEFHPDNKYALASRELDRRHIKAKKIIEIEQENQYLQMRLADIQNLCDIKDAPVLTQEQHEKIEKKLTGIWQDHMSDPANIYIGPNYANTALGRLLKTLIPKVQAGEAAFTAFSVNLKSYGLVDDVTIEVSDWDMLLNLCFNSCYDFVYPVGEEYLTKTDADNANFNISQHKSSATALPVTTLRQYSQDRLNERLQKNPTKEEKKLLQDRLKVYKDEALEKEDSDELPATLKQRSFFWQTAPQTSKKEFMKAQIAAAREDFNKIFKLKK